MRSITTAAAFAIAASLAAGQESGKSGKSGTKSSKSGDCTDCSAGVLTRANTLTSLTYESYGQEGNVLNQQSLYDFCCGGSEQYEAYLKAVEFTSGCLVSTNSLVEQTFAALSDPNAAISEGAFLTDAVNELCEAEQSGVKPAAGDPFQPAAGDDGCEDPPPGEVCLTPIQILCIKLQLENDASCQDRGFPNHS